jgi:membrane-associated phospholipid phosphatase
MKQIIKNNQPFFITYLIIWFCVLAIVLSTTKLEQMTFINSHNSLWADWFFYVTTQMGEGWFWGLLIFAFLFIRYDKTLILVATLIVSTLISSSLKLYFDTLRPVAFFKELSINWHFVDGLEIHIHQSFPSGHTTSAFAIFTLLTLFSKHKNLGFIFVLMAWMVGYSRSYLFQHFPEDVLGGAIIGVFSGLGVYICLMRIYAKTPKNWYERNLQTTLF